MATSVLVVDDDPAVRTLLDAVLTGHGYRVVLAADGEEALRALASGPVDLVLLDDRMPGLTGVELVRRLRATAGARTLPIILVTANDAVGDRVAGLGAGADDYVVKPFEPSELVARVEARLRSHGAWEQVLEAHLEERAALARVLESVASAGTLGQRANAVCEALAELPSARGALLVAFDGEATATVIGSSGDGPWSVRRGDRLPAALTRYLRMRATVGAWIEHGAGVEGDAGLMHRGVSACAPVGCRRELAALLVLAVRGDASRVLAAAVDFATMTLALLRPELDERRRKGTERAAIEALLADHAFSPTFQPIVDLSPDGGGRVVGVEALTRFADGAPAELRFRQAAVSGLGVEFERLTMQAAVKAARRLPADRWLSLNVSPTLALELDVTDVTDVADRPVVLELSEQEQVDDYQRLRAAFDRMGPAVRLSVDDAGSGFASLRHILTLRPEFVKLDRSWVRDVDEDLPRQALIAGLHSFCERTGAGLIAEGIETERERDAVSALGVALGQGFLLGRPQPAA